MEITVRVDVDVGTFKTDVSEVDHEAIFDSGVRARMLYGGYSWFATGSTDVWRLVCAYQRSVIEHYV